MENYNKAKMATAYYESKFNAVASVQPIITGTQELSSVLAFIL